MKLFALLKLSARYKPVQKILILCATSVGFCLFGILAGLDASYSRMIAAMDLNELLSDSRFGAPMPVADIPVIQKIPGVTVVAPRGYMPVYYQTPRNAFPIAASDRRWFEARPEVAISRDQLRAFDQSRTAIVVTGGLAKRFHWKVGDKIPLLSDVPRTDGGKNWTFDLVAIIGQLPGAPDFAVVRYDYYDGERSRNKGTVSRFIVRIDNPGRATQISRTIDALFANTSAPTRTGPAKLLVQTSLHQVFDIDFFTRRVTGAVVFMLLFMATNVMILSVRNRRRQFGILKTLGLTDAALFGLVVAESLALFAIGAVVGVIVSALLSPVLNGAIQIPSSFGQLVPFEVPWIVFLAALILAAIMALAAAAWPAWRASRLSIVDALRAP